MKPVYFCLFALILILSAQPINAVYAAEAPEQQNQDQQDQTENLEKDFIVVTDVQGCDTDLQKHCPEVTPGENREIICLIAFEDKLTPQCKIGLIEAAMISKISLLSIEYAYDACLYDRTNVCSNVAAGNGQLLACLKANEDKISSGCTTALKDTGFWEAQIEPASGEETEQ